MEITQYSLKYRPIYFRDVFGQDSTVKALKTRIANNDYPQAICLRGPFGCGKSSLAYIVAAAMMSHDAEGEPNWDNPDCQSILSQAFDRDVLLLDASRWSGKDAMLEFTQQLNYQPLYSSSGLRVCIIEEADQASQAAMLSLLKILESTKPWNKFILCSMEEKGIPASVLSRCQTYQIRALGEKDIMLGLKRVMEQDNKWQDPEIPNEFRLQGLQTIAMAAKGSMRSAVQYLEKAIVNKAWTPDEINDLLEIVTEAKLWQILDGLIAKTKDPTVWNTLLHLKTGDEVIHAVNYMTMMLAEANIVRQTGCVYDDSTRARLERMGAQDEAARLLYCLTLHPQMNKPYLRNTDLLACLSAYYDGIDFRPNTMPRIETVTVQRLVEEKPVVKTVTQEVQQLEEPKIVIGVEHPEKDILKPEVKNGRPRRPIAPSIENLNIAF